LLQRYRKRENFMTKSTNEPWAAWAEQMQQWMGNPAALNPFSMPSGLANPFAAMKGVGSLDPAAMMKAINPEEIDRRIADMRAVETWLKFSLSTLEMSIKTMQMQRDAYASFAKMNESATAGAEAVRKTVKRAARTSSAKRR
jgi:hypothetical protein